MLSPNSQGLRSDSRTVDGRSDSPRVDRAFNRARPKLSPRFDTRRRQDPPPRVLSADRVASGRSTAVMQEFPGIQLDPFLTPLGLDDVYESNRCLNVSSNLERRRRRGRETDRRHGSSPLEYAQSRPADSGFPPRSGCGSRDGFTSAIDTAVRLWSFPSDDSWQSTNAIEMEVPRARRHRIHRWLHTELQEARLEDAGLTPWP